MWLRRWTSVVTWGGCSPRVSLGLRSSRSATTNCIRLFCSSRSGSDSVPSITGMRDSTHEGTSTLPNDMPAAEFMDSMDEFGDPLPAPDVAAPDQTADSIESPQSLISSFDPRFVRLIGTYNAGAKLEFVPKKISQFPHEGALYPALVSEDKAEELDRRFTRYGTHIKFFPGDILVHQDHGVCRFLGLAPPAHTGILEDLDQRDRILLQFINGVYALGIDHLTRLDRYAGPSSKAPPSAMFGLGWISRIAKLRERLRGQALLAVESHVYVSLLMAPQIEKLDHSVAIKEPVLSKMFRYTDVLPSLNWDQLENLDSSEFTDSYLNNKFPILPATAGYGKRTYEAICKMGITDIHSLISKYEELGDEQLQSIILEKLGRKASHIARSLSEAFDTISKGAKLLELMNSVQEDLQQNPDRQLAEFLNHRCVARDGRVSSLPSLVVDLPVLDLAERKYWFERFCVAGGSEDAFDNERILAASPLVREIPFTSMWDAVSEQMSSRSLRALLSGRCTAGKLEIVDRAIAAAILAGKQVVIVVPSSIRAKEHVERLQDRLSWAVPGVKIGLLTRLVNFKDQRRIRSEFRVGSIQILVTTGIYFKDQRGTADNLALLVTEDEHEVGYAYMNPLSDLKVGVHWIAICGSNLSLASMDFLKCAWSVFQFSGISASTSVDVLSVAGTDNGASLEASAIDISSGSPLNALRSNVEFMHDSDESFRLLFDRFPQIHVFGSHFRTDRSSADRIARLVPAGGSVQTAIGNMNIEKFERDFEHFLNGNIDVIISSVFLDWIRRCSAKGIPMVIVRPRSFPIRQLERVAHSLTEEGCQTKVIFLDEDPDPRHARAYWKLALSGIHGAVNPEDDCTASLHFMGSVYHRHTQVGPVVYQRLFANAMYDTVIDLAKNPEKRLELIQRCRLRRMNRTDIPREGRHPFLLYEDWREVRMNILQEEEEAQASSQSMLTEEGTKLEIPEEVYDIPLDVFWLTTRDLSASQREIFLRERRELLQELERQSIRDAEEIFLPLLEGFQISRTILQPLGPIPSLVLEEEKEQLSEETKKKMQQVVDNFEKETERRRKKSSARAVEREDEDGEEEEELDEADEEDVEQEASGEFSDGADVDEPHATEREPFFLNRVSTGPVLTSDEDMDDASSAFVDEDEPHRGKNGHEIDSDESGQSESKSLSSSGMPAIVATTDFYTIDFTDPSMCVSFAPSYIPDPFVRMAVYQGVVDASSFTASSSALRKLVDLVVQDYGPLTPSACGVFNLGLLRVMCRQLGMYRISLRTDEIVYVPRRMFSPESGEAPPPIVAEYQVPYHGAHRDSADPVFPLGAHLMSLSNLTNNSPPCDYRREDEQQDPLLMPASIRRSRDRQSALDKLGSWYKEGSGSLLAPGRLPVNPFDREADMYRMMESATATDFDVRFPADAPNSVQLISKEFALGEKFDPVDVLIQSSISSDTQVDKNLGLIVGPASFSDSLSADDAESDILLRVDRDRRIAAREFSERRKAFVIRYDSTHGVFRERVAFYRAEDAVRHVYDVLARLCDMNELTVEPLFVAAQKDQQ